MAFNRSTVSLLQGGREISDQVLQQQRFVREIARKQSIVSHDLRIGEQDRNFRPCQAQIRRNATRDFLFVRQKFYFPIKKGSTFEAAHEAILAVKQTVRPCLRRRDGLGLLVIVTQNKCSHFFGHAAQKLVSLLHRHIATLHDIAENNFYVDLMVGAIDARRIVDEVGIDPPPRHSKLDPPKLRRPEVGPLAYHFAV